MKTKIFKILLITALLVVSFASYYEKDTYLGYSLYTVTSESMKPKVNKGSIVFVKSGQNEYYVDDIITFKYPLNMRNYITHRIVDKSFDGQYYYLSKGDYNKTPDPWQIREDLIVGRVIFSIPYIGYLVKFIRGPIGLFSLIILPLGIIFLIELDKLAKESKVYCDIIYESLRPYWKHNFNIIKRRFKFFYRK